jgi:AcrR family transcriptional regulator
VKKLYLQTKSFNKFSLEEIAQQAGVSKGGLLHHFPSKERVLEAIIQHLLQAFEARVLTFMAHEPQRPGRWLRAYIKASFEESSSEMEHSTMLLSFLADQPALMQMIRDDFERWSERLLHDGVPLARAIIIRQAADATWVDRLLDISPETAVQKQVYDVLAMTEVSE